MSSPAPPMLLDLAAHRLLSSEPSAPAALQEFTVDLFPALLTAAFSMGHKEALKALVQAWPFPVLRLGSLIAQWPSQDSLQAVLDGLGDLSSHKACPRRSSLRVLDLTLAFEQVQGREPSEALSRFPFWFPCTVKAETPQDVARPRPVEDSTEEPLGSWEPVELHVDLFLRGPFQSDAFLSTLLAKVEQSQGSLRVCCKKLHIEEMPSDSHGGTLQILELDSIQELEVFDWFQALAEHSLFASQLGRIRNLRSLKLAYYHWAFPLEGGLSSDHILSQLGQLHHLQRLHLSYSYLSGNLHQVLSCLQNPLHTLEICSCTLVESDVTFLAQSVHTTRLKKLDLSGNNLSYMVPGPLEALLRAVAGTLQHLNLTHCWLKDTHLHALLPTLCRCAHLSSLDLSDNPFSQAGLVDLLEHTATLVALKQVLYPVPVECCPYLHGLSRGPVDGRKLCQVQTELQALLQALRRPDMQWSSPPPLSPSPGTLVQPE
ncbi:melanoma antigen preferentially expressed in tumors [Orycteropus afer afer]|uniref:Leucine-rich repeat-containing protein 14 n=1 Tax=Orycteropus afer afer TaxID=1230840 RepID=A0A8B7B0D8_ORYAF|nr:melanoma antigen preferentially expressed in tumors [Orycteropus afer afer]